MDFFSHLVVDLAYFLNTSDGYQQKKQFFYNILENNRYQYKKYFDLFMMSLIFLSVAILIAEVKNDVHYFIKFFNKLKPIHDGHFEIR